MPILVVGRKLVGVTAEMTLVGFRTYDAGSDVLPAEQMGYKLLKLAFDQFCAELGRVSGLELGNQGIPRMLFADDWYNDGLESFDPLWMEHTPEEVREAVRTGGEIADGLVSALSDPNWEREQQATRAILWLGEDGLHMIDRALGTRGAAEDEGVRQALELARSLLCTGWPDSGAPGPSTTS